MGRWSDGYVQVPKEFLLCRGLTGNVLKTLVAVMGFAYGSRLTCWPSHDTLAQVTGFTRRTIIAHMAFLVKQGFLEREVRPGRTTLYTIVPKKFSPDLRKSMKEALPRLHPLLRRKTTNKEWGILIKHDRILGHKAGR